MASTAPENKRLKPLRRRADGKPDDVPMSDPEPCLRMNVLEKKIAQRAQTRGGDSLASKIFDSFDLRLDQQLALNTGNGMSDVDQVGAAQDPRALRSAAPPARRK